LDDLATGVHNLLNTIQADLFAVAKKEYDERLKVVTDWKDFVPSLNAKNICVAPWCEVEACEDDIKEQSAKECVLSGLARALLTASSRSAAVQDERAPSAGAKTLCMPFDQERWGKLPGKCIKCDMAPTKWCLFGRSY
jgi:prolyl-tRNA synthetase